VAQGGFRCYWRRKSKPGGRPKIDPEIPEKCHQEMRKGRWWEAKTESQDINRMYRVGDKYLTASRYGLKTYPVKRPQRTMQKLRFPGDFADCGIGRAKN
jgi:hypothetical protein